MPIAQSSFGVTRQGQAVDRYTLSNGHGLSAGLITYGATLTELLVPDRRGQTADVVLGFDHLADYETRSPYFGCICGRVANRIAGGRFTLDGREYRLAINNGPNHLHGGREGFDKKVWRCEVIDAPEGVAVRFSLTSPDGDEGYPGNLAVSVTYTLTEGNELRLDYQAGADRPTPVNLTNHAYFNLAGHASGDVLGHQLHLAAGAFTPVDDTAIPTGEIRPVAGSPMDFTRPAAIGSRLGQVPGPAPGGYDHNYVLDHAGGAGRPGPCARVVEPNSGRVLVIQTTEPGVQLYTGNFLNGSITGKGGAVYGRHAGLCLECQHFPDSVNQPAFPSVILRPGATYTQTTVHRFGIAR